MDNFSIETECETKLFVRHKQSSEIFRDQMNSKSDLIQHKIDKTFFLMDPLWTSSTSYIFSFSLLSDLLCFATIHIFRLRKVHKWYLKDYA